MFGKLQQHLAAQLDGIRAAGTYKSERVIASPQDAHIEVAGGQRVLNMCANNYLGLAEHPEVLAAAHAALDRWGYGLASVRFICGTQELHKQLERAISDFTCGTEDTILYSSCFDANGGLFETLLGAEDAVISDNELNHASIIDGVRLCKAQRYRYRNNDMADLECEAGRDQRRAVSPDRDRWRVLDGRLHREPRRGLRSSRKSTMQLVMVDDSHAVGFMGRTGRGTHEHCGAMGRVDLITGTLGKALGGASGGYTSGPPARDRGIPPAAVAAVSFFQHPRALDCGCVAQSAGTAQQFDGVARQACGEHAVLREAMTAHGFDIPLPGTHPIVPIMLGEAALAGRVAEAMLARGVYVIGFSYPVVPQGKARIRTQISAAHSREDLGIRCRTIHRR